LPEEAGSLAARAEQPRRKDVPSGTAVRTLRSNEMEEKIKDRQARRLVSERLRRYYNALIESFQTGTREFFGQILDRQREQERSKEAPPSGDGGAVGRR
jgi:hypothetical protein